MELKNINAAMFEKKERKPPKPSYRQLFGVKDPNKKKSKASSKPSPRRATKSKRPY